MLKAPRDRSTRIHLLLLLICVSGLILGLQGWKSATPAADMLRHIDNAKRLLTEGVIPDSGVLTSFAAYTPPGLSWLFVPGMLLFSDPRLFETIGAAALYLLALAGIFLLARVYSNERWAALAAAMYAFSALGLLSASELYDRFALHPFYVWMVYWTVQWVRRRDGNYLAAALLTFVAGIYVFPEMAPSFFILPGAWLFYRPPVKTLPLLIVSGLGLAICFPYLRFEQARSFADIKSLVKRQTILPENFRNSWCDPNFEVANSGRLVNPSHNQPSDVRSGRGLYGLAGKAISANKMLPTFNNIAPLRGLDVVMFWLTVAGVFALSLSPVSLPTTPRRTESQQKLLKWAAFAMIILAVVVNEFVAERLTFDGILAAETRSSIRIGQVLLVLLGAFIYKLAHSGSGPSLNRMRITYDESNAVDTRPLALCFVIPWFIVFLLISNDRFDRFAWLWTVHVVVLTAVFTHLPFRLQIPSVVIRLGVVLLLGAVVANPLLIARAESWIHSGWAGADADRFQVMDFVAADMRAHGKTAASVGYELGNDNFSAKFHSIDSQYKVGSAFDFLLSYRHDMSNTNVCAEGISPYDEYRIVEVRAGMAVNPAGATSAVSSDRFQTLREFGVYELFKRSEPPRTLQEASGGKRLP